ncbi:hypothetical protein HDV06_000804 [Boothiomyces sp. JEL0866]|nr:hypothetical protein HDV06_000804 [Boothiomyces sp. JEL0866]
MTVHVKSHKDIPQFTVRRVVAYGRRKDRASLVTKLELKDLKVVNLKTVQPREFKNSTIYTCSFPEHSNCIGHLQAINDMCVGFPSFCTVDDEELLDKRGYANRRLFSEEISSKDFCDTIMQTFLGKNGMFRAGLLSFRPLTSCRGVASLVETPDPNIIFLPRKWMNNMQIPVRLEVPNEKLRSPYYTFRQATDGDYGIVLRCPVILIGSVQPVKIYGWDNYSVGCNANLCERMNLDFDGDEVHVCIVSSTKSVNEVKEAIKKETSVKFSTDSINRAKEYCPDGVVDFMLSSTTSITEIDSISYSNPLFKLSRCKESARLSSSLIYKEELNPSSYITSGLKRVKDITESQLAICKKYVLARQLKNVSLESVPRSNRFEDFWTKKWNDLSILIPDGVKVYGNPSCRFATKLTQSIVQGALDKAKHDGSIDGNILSNSLITNSLPYLVVYRDGKDFVQKVLKTPTEILDYKVFPLLVVTSRQAIKLLNYKSTRILQLCYSTIKYMAFYYGIEHDESEILAFSNFIYKTIISSSEIRVRKIADVEPTDFLRYSDSNFLTSVMCCNMKSIDSLKLNDSNIQRLEISSSSFFSAVSMGNLSCFLTSSISS